MISRDSDALRELGSGASFVFGQTLTLGRRAWDALPAGLPLMVGHTELVGKVVSGEPFETFRFVYPYLLRRREQLLA